MREPDLSAAREMTEPEVLDVFREADAILEGHFILSSGLRSPVFLQKARVFMYPDKTERLCRALAAKLRAIGLGRIDFVVSPAVGAIVPGYETARQLGVRSMWVEREDGIFRLRRFELPPGARVVIVEDIVTTGLSIREAIEAVRGLGAEVVAAACLIDRSAGEAEVGVPLIALANYKIPAYPADALPPELAAIPPVKPGSRGLA
jgi:orotate phosphoribosyltransferase